MRFLATSIILLFGGSDFGGDALSYGLIRPNLKRRIRSQRPILSFSATQLRAFSNYDDQKSLPRERYQSKHHQRSPYRHNPMNNSTTGTSSSIYAGRKYRRNRFHDDKSAAESLRHRQKWLQQATQDILLTKPGTLVKGKWHELHSMIKAWSRYAKIDPEAPLVMERLIKRLLDEKEVGGNVEAMIDIDTYNRLLDAWCCAALFRTQANQGRSPNVASQRAREILVSLQENYEASLELSSRQPKPNGESFSMVYDVVLKVEGPTVARRVLAWLEYIHKMNRNHLAKPTRSYYIRLLHAYANSGKGQQAEGFLKHMNATGETPDTLCWNVCIKAYTKAKRGRESAEHADRYLEEMPVPKDLVTYSTVISAWGASGMRSHAVARAEELLRDIEDTPNLHPNTVVLNTVMSTWVKSMNPAAVNRTAELLEYMENSEHAPPDLISYNTHLHALATHSRTRTGCGQRANDLLDSLLKKSDRGEISFRTNLFTYNCVIDAWCKSQEQDSAWNAVKVLMGLIQSDRGPKPDLYSFNQVLTALSRCNKPGSTQLSEQLLDYMEDVYNMHDIISYAAVITGLARSGESDAAERGEHLLQRVKAHYASGKSYMRPNNVLYNAVIDLWAKSGKGTYGARKAEALLREMDELRASPNTITYNSVIQSWAKSGTRCCGNKAEAYLDRMWQLYHTQGEIKPNDLTFLAVINAVSKSQNEGKAQKALRILRRMDKLYRNGYKFARPNAFTYTSVLNAAAFPALSTDEKTKRKALDTAIFTLRELRASGYDHPNELTYSTFLKACSNLLSDDDETLRAVIEETFEQCKRDGQVGEKFLYRLREAAPDDLYKQLLSEVVVSEKSDISVADLPPSWSSNLRNNRSRMRRRDKI
ncbi:PPR: pentatricopeptide repeat domain containing protein [Nitzschia inconspicua]|uniref:PPR: pentatricopeptide repeat domain containing protein n=1 Tax=Nitzschia inconspicua TaxID=303405 RepID=A0A9K3KEA8_9STRA|nr:PPR: pentatricopeptide repeat domain containing protein [Nitzschia inconspicua]